jgi:16S rRNA (guanine527-N7)-methyltransferase
MELFWVYLRELSEWTRRFNLTAIKDPEDIIIKHFVDSLTPLPHLGRCTGLLDIGSGAGFPGIPLKIVAPQLEVQLVDASRKKVSFLKHLIRTLRLQQITAIHGRIEDMPQQESSPQIFISRAFRRLETLLQLVMPFLREGNTLVAMLGLTMPEEQWRLEQCASEQGLELTRAVSFHLPYGRGGRTLLFFEKR